MGGEQLGGLAACLCGWVTTGNPQARETEVTTTACRSSVQQQLADDAALAPALLTTRSCAGGLASPTMLPRRTPTPPSPRPSRSTRRGCKSTTQAGAGEVVQ